MIESTLEVGGAVVFWSASAFTDRDRLTAGLAPLALDQFVPDPRPHAGVLRDALEEALGGPRVLVRPLTSTTCRSRARPSRRARSFPLPARRPPMTRDWRARMIDPGHARSLLFVTDPRRWPLYPVLPLVRRTRGSEECGCRVDVRGLFGVTGFSATVFLENAFVIPLCFTRLLSLPRESYDSAEALLAGGWRVDV